MWFEHLKSQYADQFATAFYIKVECCVFQPAFGCCTHQKLEKILFSPFSYIFFIFKFFHKKLRDLLSQDPLAVNSSTTDYIWHKTVISPFCSPSHEIIQAKVCDRTDKSLTQFPGGCFFFQLNLLSPYLLCCWGII